MSQGNSKIRVNTTADKLNYVLHGAGYTATFIAVAAFVSSPIIAATAVTAAFFTTLPLSRQVNAWMVEALPSTKSAKIPYRSQSLPVILDKLAKRLNMGDTPQLHVLDVAHSKRSPVVASIKQSGFINRLKEGLLKIFGKPKQDFIIAEAVSEALGVFIKQQLSSLRPQKDAPRKLPDRSGTQAESPALILKNAIQKIIGKSANAAAFGDGTYGIFVSRPLLQILPALKKKTAALAHELGHLAPEHLRNATIINIIGRSAYFMAGINFLVTVVTSVSGWAAFGSGAVANLVTRQSLTKIGIDPKAEQGKTALRNVSRLTSTAAFLAAACLTRKRKDILIAWGVTALTNCTREAIGAHYSRCNEFHADRIAAQLTQDPQIVADTLRDINAYNISIRPEIVKRDYKKGPLILRPFKRAQAIFWSHPHIDKRCERLEKMALSMDTHRNALLP